jgi:2-keto-3-deoxy-L-rhamnonate aldolase RhmA
MIEDARAIEVIDDIVSVEGIDCIFMGRGDLGLSLSNAGPSAPPLKDAVETICAACRKHGKPVSAVVQQMDSDEARWLIDLGVTAMMVASDQGFMRTAAGAALADFRRIMVKA